MKLCEVDGCSRKFYGKYLCQAHYMRLRRNGDLQIDKAISESFSSVKERFMSKVSSVMNENECMNWIGCSNRYGRFTTGSRMDKTKTTKLAHRVAYELFVGEIPGGMYVLHRCDNTKCVNFRHLFLGTQLDNMKDMITKGRDNKVKALTR